MPLAYVSCPPRTPQTTELKPYFFNILDNSRKGTEYYPNVPISPTYHDVLAPAFRPHNQPRSATGCGTYTVGGVWPWSQQGCIDGVFDVLVRG